jgi:predicted house-cleaning noncanonical NTP pyrophosphatase (MazG superfamily)
MKYNKLVRDRIPEIIEKNGAKAVTRILSNEEYKAYLEKKLDEEVAEYHESKDITELVDILEVIYALCDASGWLLHDLCGERAKKANERGAFTQKILLIETIEKAERGEQ